MFILLIVVLIISKYYTVLPLCLLIFQSRLYKLYTFQIILILSLVLVPI